MNTKHPYKWCAPAGIQFLTEKEAGQAGGREIISRAVLSKVGESAVFLFDEAVHP